MTKSGPLALAIGICLFAVCAYMPTQSADLLEFSGVVTDVEDGDDFFMGTRQIRLWGIDAGEMGRPDESKTFLRRLLVGKQLRCVTKRRLKPRTVAQCFFEDGRDVSCAVAWAGYGRDWPKYSNGYYADCDRVTPYVLQLDKSPPPK